ncbi:MAG: GNAT family N-acetyltransferase [Pseudomonadaceae bacterium]|nr:GNAT family N-acetyltransferase [Pseudomonadaceae bacterium]
MSYPIDVRGSRVLLREWQASDVDGFTRWIADPVVNKFLTWGATNRSEAEVQLAEAISAQSVTPRLKYFLAMELIDTPGLTIGDAGFTWIGDDVAEIGYFLEPAYWGNGYATDAAQTMTKLAFELGAKHVIASCFADNTASENVMKRCNMVKQPTSDKNRLVYRIARDQ